MFGAALLVLAADQISKHLVRVHLNHSMPWSPASWLRPILSLTYVTNRGAAFGLFPKLAWLYTLIAVVVVALILLSYRRLPLDHWLVHLSLGLQLGGATGNLVERLWHGWQSWVADGQWVAWVTDFIDLNFWPLQQWPVFNLADSAIVVGSCILAVLLLLEEEPTSACPDTQLGEDEVGH